MSFNFAARVTYLLLLILFLLGIGFFAFDYFGLIDASEYFSFLRREPNPISLDRESPTELEKLEMKKEKEKLLSEKEELELLRLQMEEETLLIKSEKLRLEELRVGIQQKELESKRKIELENSRKEKVKILANKIANMPPEKARDMLTNWPDYDIIEVFEQMDKDAEEDGRQTITTYLLTLFPAERRSMISNKWLEYGRKKLEE